MKSIALLLIAASCVFAHATYTGYSGAPGSNGTCASSCHGSTGGTLVLNGAPAVYEPLKTYTLVVKHNGGSKITNLNISTRKGTITAVAGTLAAGTGAVAYSVSGGEAGVHCSTTNFDSLGAQWTAPAAGTGPVKIFVAGIQGGHSGQNSTVVATISESTMGVSDLSISPGSFALAQNYPNPFNPSTTIRFTLPTQQRVVLRVHDMAGRQVAMLADGEFPAGEHDLVWNAAGIPSGSYVCTLTSGSKSISKSLVLLK